MSEVESRLYDKFNITVTDIKALLADSGALHSSLFPSSWMLRVQSRDFHHLILFLKGTERSRLCRGRLAHGADSGRLRVPHRAERRHAARVLQHRQVRLHTAAAVSLV